MQPSPQRPRTILIDTEKPLPASPSPRPVLSSSSSSNSKSVPANFIPKPFVPSMPVPYIPRSNSSAHRKPASNSTTHDARKALVIRGILRTPEERKRFEERKLLEEIAKLPRRPATLLTDALPRNAAPATRTIHGGRAITANTVIGELGQPVIVADLGEGEPNPNDAILVKRGPEEVPPTFMTRAELDRHDQTDRARLLRLACHSTGLASVLAYYYDKRPVPLRAGIQLHPYQVHTLTWMTLREQNAVHGISGGVIGFEPGLGKTITASLHALWSPRPVTGPTLIVAPLNVLKEWRAHFDKFYDVDALGARIVYMHPEFNPNTPFLRATDLRDADLVLTTYEMIMSSLDQTPADEADAGVEYVNDETRKKIASIHLRTHADVNMSDSTVRGVALIHRGVAWGRLMLDESQRIANPLSKGYRAVMAIAAPLRWCITGTIVRNYVTDVWSQMRAVGYDKVAYKTDWNKATAPRLYETHKLSSVVYGLTYEQAGITLPPFTEETVRVSLTPRERTIYDMAERKARTIYLEAASARLAASTALALITRLRRLTVAATLLDTSGAISDSQIEDFDDAIEALFRADTAQRGSDDEDYSRFVASSSDEEEDEYDNDEDDEPARLRPEEKSPTPSEADAQGKKRARDTDDDDENEKSSGSEKRARMGDAKDVSGAEAPTFASSKEALAFCINVEGEGGVGASKIRAIVDVIVRHLSRGPEHKITCFSMWKSALSLVLKAASQHPALRDVKSVQVDGKTTGKARDALLNTFRTDPTVRILGLQGKIGGEGLNLQQATGGVGIEPHWTYQAKKQQRRRFWRIGQDKPTWWYDVIVENTIEARVLAICDEKVKIEEEFKAKRRHGRAAPDAVKAVHGKLLGIVPTAAGKH
jgi:SNF2 family DNA or RNA helicase